MTMLDVVFRYGVPPNEDEMRAIGSVREVYGIRALRFNEKERMVRVEFDASRLSDDIVESLLRKAGLDITERVQLV